MSGAIKPILTVTDLHAVYHGTANPFGPGGATVTYTVHNSGNIRLAATEQVRVSGLWGAVSATAPPGTLPEILPGDSRTRTVEVADVWPMFHETATVQLTPSAGQDQPTTTIAAVSVDKALWAWPWAALVLIAAVALLVVILIRRRRAGRRKVASAIESAGRAGIGGGARATASPRGPTGGSTKGSARPAMSAASTETDSVPTTSDGRGGSAPVSRRCWWPTKDGSICVRRARVPLHRATLEACPLSLRKLLFAVTTD